MFHTAEEAHLRRSQMKLATMFKNTAKYISEGITEMYLRFTCKYKSFTSSVARVPAWRVGLWPTRATLER